VPLIGKKKLQALTPEILQELQNRLFLNKAIDLRERAIVGLGALAGLRQSEVIGLTWDKIDFRSHTIHIDMQYCQGEYKRPKHGSIRIVPILPGLEPLLKEYRLQSSSMRWVFPGVKGQPMAGDA